jgi:hypothetical protein
VDGRGLIVAAIAGSAACRGALADNAVVADIDPAVEPRHGIDVPDDWRELPEVGSAAVAAARALLGEDANVHAHAWGEPSRGCYLAVVEAFGARKDRIIDVAGELQNALGASLEVTEWTASPDAETASEIQARFTGMAPAAHGMSGLFHVHLALDAEKFPHAVAAACFYNDRQPALCENACVPLLAMLVAPESSP